MEIRNIASPSLRDLLNIIFKRKLSIMLFFCAVVGIVAAKTFVTQPTYEAVSRVLVKAGRENVYLSTGATTDSLVNLIPVEHINSEIQILESQPLAEKVVELLDPTVIYGETNGRDRGILSLSRFLPLTETEKPPVEPVENAALRLLKALTVKGIRRSNVIEVSFKHKDPRMAATVVNTFIKLYLDQHREIHKNPLSYKFLKDQFQELENRLKQAEEKIEAFKNRYGISSIEAERDILLRKEADLRAELNQTLSLEAETRNRIRQLQIQLAVTPKTTPQDEVVEQTNLIIATLQQRLVELEISEKELLTKYTDQNRLVQGVREEIQMVRKRLAEVEKKEYGRRRSGINVTYLRLEQELLTNESELKALQAKEATQRTQLPEYQEKLERLNQLEVQFNQLQSDKEVHEDNYRLYLKKLEESRISDAMDAEKIGNVTQIQPARPPLKPVSPKVRLNMLIAVFLGGFGGLGLAFFREYLDDRLERPEDTENALDLPVLASIPDLKQY